MRSRSQPPASGLCMKTRGLQPAMCAHPTPEWCLALRTRWRQNGSKNMSRPASEVPVASAPANLGLLATTLILSGCLAYGYITCGAISPAAPVAGAAASASSWASNGISESSSGTLFRAVRTRSYPGETLFASWTVRYGTASTHFCHISRLPGVDGEFFPCVCVGSACFFFSCLFISSRRRRSQPHPSCASRASRRAETGR